MCFPHRNVARPECEFAVDCGGNTAGTHTVEYEMWTKGQVHRQKHLSTVVCIIGVTFITPTHIIGWLQW